MDCLTLEVYTGWGKTKMKTYGWTFSFRTTVYSTRYGWSHLPSLPLLTFISLAVSTLR